LEEEGIWQCYYLYFFVSMHLSSILGRHTHLSRLDGSTSSIVRTNANLLAKLAEILDISDLGQGVVPKVVHQHFILFRWHIPALFVLRGTRLLEFEAAFGDAGGTGAWLGYCGVDAEVLPRAKGQVFELFHLFLICSPGGLRVLFSGIGS